MDDFSAALTDGLNFFKREGAAAREQGVCVLCKETATFTTDAGRREYQISGTCEPCFDILFPDDEEV